MKLPSTVLLFFLVVAVTVGVVRGDYSIEPYTVTNGTADMLGADGTVPFTGLPLWIQLGWIGGSLLALFGAIKLGPLVLGKVRIILKNENRAAILDYIGKNPGCTLADLTRNAGLNRGTAKYHLYLLLLEKKVVRKKGEKLGYLFTNGGIPLEKKQVYGYVMNPAKREILEAILLQPGISNKEIATRLEADPSTIHWHLRQLLVEKMVVSRRDGRSMNFVLLPEVEAILRQFPK